MSRLYSAQVFFFFNDTATTEIYTLSLHDALPISASASRNRSRSWPAEAGASRVAATCRRGSTDDGILHSPSRVARSEEHTSELQSQSNLVCRLLLEKKKSTYPISIHNLMPDNSTF